MNHHLAEQTAVSHQQNRAILIALLFPTIAIILNGSMFGVALPTIRDEFAMPADVAAWLTIAFSLPFMMLMPLYGRLGDELGKQRLLVGGILIFALGSLLAVFANGLLLVFLGRIIQGAGSAGITPLSLAIISERFSPAERGKALGSWNSIGPATSLFAPSIGGFMVDSIGWRTIFLPAVFIAALAVFIVRWKVPTLRNKPNLAFLRHFDWGGVVLLSGTIILLVLYVSSRPVTGVEPLHDWRLLLGLLLTAVTFVYWERQQTTPLVDLNIFRERGFRLASLAAGMRMAMMVGISFLLPLYLNDLYQLNAATIGFIATAHSLALFVLIRYGGSLSDRWPSRRLVAGGLTVQLLTMGYFGLLPSGLSLGWVIVGVVVHGLGAGVSLAALHRTALSQVESAQSGVAAGVYSMTRFAGSMLATALVGVILENGLTSGLAPLAAYQMGYGFLTAVGLLGAVLSLRIPR